VRSALRSASPLLDLPPLLRYCIRPGIRPAVTGKNGDPAHESSEHHGNFHADGGVHHDLRGIDDHQEAEPLHISFAALCLAIAFHKGGVLFNEVFPHGAWLLIEQLGLLAIPPLTIKFSRDLFREQTLLTKRDIGTTTVFSAVFAIALLTPVARWDPLAKALYFYADAVLLLCYFSLIVFAKKRAAGVERNGSST